MCIMFEENSINERIGQQWLSKFLDGWAILLEKQYKTWGYSKSYLFSLLKLKFRGFIKEEIYSLKPC